MVISRIGACTIGPSFTSTVLSSDGIACVITPYTIYSFGYEIICGCTACQKVEALTYNFWMFGMRVEGPANMYVDNYLMVKSVTMPESRLNNKHLVICFHAVREEVATSRYELAGC